MLILTFLLTNVFRKLGIIYVIVMYELFYFSVVAYALIAVLVPRVRDYLLDGMPIIQFVIHVINNVIKVLLVHFVTEHIELLLIEKWSNVFHVENISTVLVILRLST